MRKELLLPALLLAANVSAPTWAASSETAVFTAPNNLAGQKGESGLTAHGPVTHPSLTDLKDPTEVGLSSWPQEGEWHLDSAMELANGWIRITMAVTNTGGMNGQYPLRYIGLLTAINKCPSTSPSGFTDWGVLLWTNPENSLLRMHDLNVIQHPSDANKMIGTLAWTRYTFDGATYTRVELGVSRVNIDFSNSTFQIGKPGSWQTYSFGSELVTPPAKVVGMTRSSLVNLGNGVVDFWRAINTTRSAYPPCSPTTSWYDYNTSEDTNGSRLRTRRYNLVTDEFLTDWSQINLGNMTFQAWSDYQTSLFTVRGIVYNQGPRYILYVAQRDQVVCTSNLRDHWNKYAGTGVRYLRVTDDGTGSFSGAAANYFLDVQTPNWSCAGGGSWCYENSVLGYIIYDSALMLQHSNGMVFAFLGPFRKEPTEPVQVCQ